MSDDHLAQKLAQKLAQLRARKAELLEQFRAIANELGDIEWKIKRLSRRLTPETEPTEAD